MSLSDNEIDQMIVDLDEGYKALLRSYMLLEEIHDRSLKNTFAFELKTLTKELSVIENILKVELKKRVQNDKVVNLNYVKILKKLEK